MIVPDSEILRIAGALYKAYDGVVDNDLTAIALALDEIKAVLDAIAAEIPTKQTYSS